MENDMSNETKFLMCYVALSTLVGLALALILQPYGF